MGTPGKIARINVILPDQGDASPHLTDATVLRLARMIGRQMAREDYERQKRARRRTRRPSVPGQKS
ncbi:hypothetical protein [Acidomonas methanolica]|uniref:Uncharacterized protein n=1 Tax=Acidomonas methanolica NBRC 104435 TaxID=1231351 RepID=A0A023D4H4_ACIMT|nr:hypothetical protein [Acidomonas methanolica]TCS19714.1 hypothetical protein EDC31_1519 [Acidomonas methanolica]GAJ29068.1 hypothetical protein Amme_044_002 [Acidomonas methanolica NBRC 104435]GBQ49202.1 hypothetical protein AA0498_0930 [Acidomonas methanolica]GEL00661.1 hypothetical protein AME01nite_31590 [Acidomonas methanolica NBRC 104435]